ncbi:EAL domain-containing protein [Janthinobacterium sp. 17J80-10]|uniref:bifunctional diguanylate cyclase/phosphodiesterase n=1 Tax=Janthinobacterium sp. 17J80-10 TaxID=2497863 RepID=UPI0013E8D4DE|nr:EAL domain-containing protein [Janthinobacterium sp. 17J80-10]
MPRKNDEQHLRRLIAFFSALIILAILANLVFSLTQSRWNVLTERGNTAQKLVQVLEEQTSGSINAVELALQAITKSLQLLPAQSPDRKRMVQEIMEGNIRNLPFVRAIWVLDSEGNMIHDSQQLPGRYNLSDREYFRLHRDNPAHGLYIDRPILSKLGVWFIAISTRISRPDGSFGGVVVAAFEPKYLERFYESIKIGKDGVVTLLGIDGTLMLRVPLMEGVYGEKLNPLPKFIQMLPSANAGSYQSKSSIDAVERMYFYRRVTGRPLVVAVGIGENEALAAWRSFAQSHVVASLAFVLVIAMLTYLTLHEVNKRAALHRALRERESALAHAQQLAYIGSWRMELKTMAVQWSLEMYRLLGIDAVNVSPTLAKFLMFFHPEDRQAIERSVQDGRAWSGELRSDPALGPLRHFHAYGTEIRDAGGNVTALAGTLQEVTERRRSDEKLHLAARVFEHTRDGIIITDAENNIVAVNAAFERITGYREAEVLGNNPRMLHSDRHDAAFHRALWDSLQKTGQWRGEIWNRRKNGEIYPEWLIVSAIRDAQNRATGYVGVFTDLSEIKEANEQLEFLINHDPLTRLPNRSLLKDRLQQAIDAAQVNHHQVALLLLNIDRLQRINDSIGHDAGDALLQEMARRLLANVQAGDTLARMGSDEFVLVLTHFENTDDIITRAMRLLDTVAAPCVISSHALTVTASIGIAIYPDDAIKPGDLLRNADAALSHVKQAGRNGFRFFTAEMNARALHLVSLEHQLRSALARNELSLHYQPQVCLKDSRICGAEALIRWNTAELGMISPADFIPMAEDTGLIVAIGEWAIRTACSQNKAWQDAGLPPLAVAVNVSMHQITAGTLPDIIRDALQQSDLAPHCLEIELTESVLMHETEMAMRQIAELRQMGVKVSLDDFGTGYSSLAYLSRFSFDKLKIDQCFVRNIMTDHKSAAIAHATIALAHGLDIIVIAEGVETKEQLEYLRGGRCDEIQGFLVSPPVPARELAAFLAKSAGISSLSKTNIE